MKKCLLAVLPILLIIMFITSCGTQISSDSKTNPSIESMTSNNPTTAKLENTNQPSQGLKTIEPLTEKDFIVNNEKNVITLGNSYSDFKVNEKEKKLDNNYVDGTTYIHKYDDFDIYVSNDYYDPVQDCISQITLRTSAFKTARKVAIGAKLADVVCIYGDGKESSRDGLVLISYRMGNKELSFDIDNEQKVKTITLYIVEDGLSSDNLGSWVGGYSFSEHADPDENMFYGISIMEHDGVYYAEISVDGFQTLKRLRAQVIGDENSIKLIFDKFLPDNVSEPYNKGDVLLSLKKKDSKLYTYWGVIQPLLKDDAASGKVYFSPTTADDGANIQSTTADSTEISNDTDSHEALEDFIETMKNNDVNALKSIVSPSGLVVIRNFSSGNGTRGKDIRNVYSANQIPSNLKFEVDGEEPIVLSELFSKSRNVLLGEIPGVDVDDCNFDFQDNIKDDTYGPSTDDVRDICSEIVGYDDSMPTLFTLGNKEAGITESTLVSDIPVGAWAVFENKGNGFYLRAIIDLR